MASRWQQQAVYFFYFDKPQPAHAGRVHDFPYLPKISLIPPLAASDWLSRLTPFCDWTTLLSLSRDRRHTASSSKMKLASRGTKGNENGSVVT